MENEEPLAVREKHNITQEEIKKAACAQTEALARPACAEEDAQKVSMPSGDLQTGLPPGHTYDGPEVHEDGYAEHENIFNRFYMNGYFNPVYCGMLKFLRGKFEDLEKRASQAYFNSFRKEDLQHLKYIRAQMANIDFYVEFHALAMHSRGDMNYALQELSLERARRDCEKSIGNDAVLHLDNIFSEKGRVDMHAVYKQLTENADAIKKFTENPDAFTEEVLERATTQLDEEYNTRFPLDIHKYIFDATVLLFSEMFEKTYMLDPVPGARDPVSRGHEEGKCLVGPPQFYKGMSLLKLVSKRFNDSVEEYWTHYRAQGFIDGNKNTFFETLVPIIDQHNEDHSETQPTVFTPADNTYDGAYELNIVRASPSTWFLEMDCRNVDEDKVQHAIASMLCHVFQESQKLPSMEEGGPAFHLLFAGPEDQTKPIYIDPFYADKVIGGDLVYHRIISFVAKAPGKVILNTGHMPLQFIQLLCKNAELLIGIGMLGKRQIYDDNLDDFFALIGAGPHFSVMYHRQYIIFNGAKVNNYLSVRHFKSLQEVVSKMDRVVVKPDLTNDDNRDQTSGRFMAMFNHNSEPLARLKKEILCTGDGMQVRCAAITQHFLMQHEWWQRKVEEV